MGDAVVIIVGLVVATIAAAIALRRRGAKSPVGWSIPKAGGPGVTRENWRLRLDAFRLAVRLLSALIALIFVVAIAQKLFS